MKLVNYITLPDNRKLAYAEFGAANGVPVVYCHEAGSSRLEPLLIGDDIFKHYGLRVIAPDRPGMGQSDFQRGRTLSDYPHDIRCLADSLGLEQFAIMGVSGGGPHAAVCAAIIPERLNAVAIVSGAWPMDWPEATKHLALANRLNWAVAKHVPVALPLLQQLLLLSFKGSHEKIRKRLRNSMPAPDYQAISKPDRLEALVKMTTETTHQDTKGSSWDLRLFVQDFGFRLDDIQIPVNLFHGGLDESVPLAMAQRGADMLPHAQLTIYEHEAHLSTLINCFDDVAQALLSGVETKTV
ncbi:MAG: alpha/beta hydrolase, partial [Chloroflexota bacterium]